MSSATVIETQGHALGLVVRLATGRFRFFSSTRDVDALDGQTFRSFAAAVRAVEERSASRRPRLQSRTRL